MCDYGSLIMYWWQDILHVLFIQRRLTLYALFTHLLEWTERFTLTQFLQNLYQNYGHLPVSCQESWPAVTYMKWIVRFTPTSLKHWSGSILIWAYISSQYQVLVISKCSQFLLNLLCPKFHLCNIVFFWGKIFG